MEYGVVVSVLMALAQLAKSIVPAKLIPVVTLVLGVVAGLVYLPHTTIAEGVMNGVVVALSANGLFDVTKVIHPTKQAQ